MATSRILSFVSFKGGSGRSVSLANIGYQLACRGARVGCVDFDIEGGGLHMIYRVDDNRLLSVQHFLMDDEDYRQYSNDERERPDFEQEDLFRQHFVIDVRQRTTLGFRDQPAFEGELFLVQAKPDARATGYVDSGANMFYRFRRLLDVFTRACSLDFVLIDCRSGISNLALPGLAYCDGVAVFLRWGIQHRFGTEQLVRWYTAWLERGGFSKALLLVASTVDSRIVDAKALATYNDEMLGGLVKNLALIPEIEMLKTEDTVLFDEESLSLQRIYQGLGDRLVELVK